MKVLWFAVAVSSGIGAVVFLALLAASESAIHGASTAGIGIAIAVIPYCFVRAISELKAVPTERRTRSWTVPREYPMPPVDEPPP